MSEKDSKNPNENPEVIAKHISGDNPPTEETIETPVIIETSYTDPLAESMEDSETLIESDLESKQKSSENNSEKPEESSGNSSGKDLENARKPLESSEKPSKESLEDLGSNYFLGGNPSKESEKPPHEEEKVTIVESQEDPLEEKEEDQAEDTKDPEVSDEYTKWLSEMSINSINFIDDMKTQICVALGGGYAADYATSPFIKNSLIRSAKELAKQKEMAAPSPMQVFVGSLLAMTAPSVMLVLFRKYIRPVPKNLNNKKADASEEAQAKTDYKNTPEYKQGRTEFKVHASSGAYQFGLKGKDDYVPVKLADSYPSPEIQKLLDEGKLTKEIRTIING